MLDYTTIHKTIGKGFADKIDEPIMNGSAALTYTRRQMIEEIGCANFIAAARLAKVLKRLKITTVKGLFKTDPVSLYRVKGIGDAAIYVAMCILDSGGFDVNAWWGHRSVDTRQESIRRAKKRKHNVPD